MTELSEPESTTAQPSQDWPDVGDAAAADPEVAQALARLSALPQIPVADHESAYNELHDELLAALNSVPTNNLPTKTMPAGADPTDGAA